MLESASTAHARELLLRGGKTASLSWDRRYKATGGRANLLGSDDWSQGITAHG